MILSKKTRVKLSKQDERLIKAMQTLGDKTRYKIFKLLLSGDEMCVTDIADSLGISVSAVSQHFKIFELVGLVDKERMGQKICYMLKGSDPIVKQLIICVSQK
ncbi:MAG TPA: metalloregulator ArsR/SmtB family transcription factor [Candidatus Dormibacteraeota bacterium]|nr:metalloregulator ArsR/SmtB family transcription factor [Candidatus Dormibacteraeota bacterium]